MLVFYIVDDEVKKFMNKILREESFDKFEVRNIELETFIKYEIKCNINKEYLEENEERFFAKWSELKPYIFQLVKGKKKPKYFKIVFSLSDNEMSTLFKDAAAMFLNVNFENDKIVCTTGTAQKNFSLDKKINIVWEDYVEKFFKNADIDIKKEELKDL